MSAVIMDGVAPAKRIKTDIWKWSKKLPYIPHLAVIMVGDNPASRTYISGKVRDCGECGFDCRVHFFTDRTTEDDLMKLIHQLNMSPSVHGIMVQLPLPPHINRHNVISAIDPEKRRGLSPPSQCSEQCCPSESRPNAVYTCRYHAAAT